MNIVITDGAFSDLTTIYNYITDNDCVESADYVLNNIQKQVYSLAELPNRGTEVKELAKIGSRNYKEIYYKPYRIIYKVTEKDVYIMVIADGRRDMATLLEKRLFSRY